MNTLSRWFSIDDDGQPTLPGWYDVRYACEVEDLPDRQYSTFYWDGEEWFMAEQSSDPSSFGNWNTQGEYWRGLTAPYKKEG